jgi:C4-dicarboxylate-specific signal transduction histidine kinase
VNRLSDDLHLSNLVDLSEQQRIEEMRRAAQDELARANRIATVGAYSATIAHELNQPIASMAMDVQTTVRWLTGETPNLEAAIRGIERLTRTVHRVQAIVEHTRESCAAAPRIAARRYQRAGACHLWSARKRGQAAEAQLVLHCDPDLALVLADPVEFQQVLVNLITNAAEAMLAGTDPRKITVEISNASEGIAVSVRDTGPGIPDDILDKLFEPFFTTKATGMGMGLQVCRNAVQGMGGTCMCGTSREAARYSALRCRVSLPWTECQAGRGRAAAALQTLSFGMFMHFDRLALRLRQAPLQACAGVL